MSQWQIPRGLRDLILLLFGMVGLTVQQLTGQVYEALTLVFASCLVAPATLRIDEHLHRLRRRIEDDEEPS